MSRYDDIIDLPHYEPRHQRMPVENRAAQFAPFAALTGHAAAISETARITDYKVELTKDEQQKISLLLKEAITTESSVTITYFVPDKLKEGGSYNEITGYIKKIDSLERKLVMKNGFTICFDNVVNLKISSDNLCE